MTRPNLKGVADAIEDAEAYVPEGAGGVVPEARKPTSPEPRCRTELDPPIGEENAQGCPPGQWTANKLGLPEDCPVRPLGHNGDTYFFLDTAGQLRAIEDREFSKLKVTSLFQGRYNYLHWAWPRFTKEGKLSSFRNEDVAAALMAACDAKGAWETADRVRGRGAWRGSKGDLILHTGGSLWIYGREQATGELGRYIYPRRPDALLPWPTRIDEVGNPAKLLVPLLRRWNWARPELDPILMAGWVAAAMIGGALDWRPIVYLSGDRGTGKSTLQRAVKRLFGPGIVATTNTTAAGIYQKVGCDSLPVAIDELEGSEDNRRAKQLLELARQACSGGDGLRGSDKGVGNSFAVKSTFLMSSINAPPMTPQDRSRVALLRLRDIDPSLPPPTLVSESDLALLGREAEGGELTDEDMARLGSMILRRMMDTFSQFPLVFKAYRDELREAGHDQRGQDTFGTLLACANLLIGESFEGLDVPMGEDLTIWRERLKAADMTEFEDDARNWRDCLAHMLTAPVDAWRGGAKITIGRVLEDFAMKADGVTYKDTRERLEQAGVTLLQPEHAGDAHWLAVPNRNPMLHKLYQGTVWAGDMSSGGWSQALQQGPKFTLWEPRQARVSGNKCRCVCISVDALYGPDGLMKDDVSNKKYS